MSDIHKEAVEALRRGSMQQDRDTDEQVDWRGVSFNTPPSAPPHGEKITMERIDSDQAQANAENIRKAIQDQPTVEQGVAALFQAISTAIHAAVERSDPATLMAIADHVDANPRDWSDALLANTQAAPLTAGPRVPQMPVYVQEAFQSHSTLQHNAEQHQANDKHGKHDDKKPATRA